MPLPLFPEYLYLLASSPENKHVLGCFKGKPLYCDALIVSVSGFTQETYQINHKGGKIEFVKNNLIKIAEAKKAGEINTDIIIRYFNFPYSYSEYSMFENFAQKIGLNIILWHGIGDPFASEIPMNQRNEERWLTENAKLFPMTNSNILHGNACSLSMTPITLDCAGDVFLCCTMPNFDSTRVGNFLDDDFDLLQYRRLSHPICYVCQHPQTSAITQDRAASLSRGLSCAMKRDFPTLSLAEKLREREVYFWGCGEIFKRSYRAFNKCKPRCVLSDLPEDRSTCSNSLAFPVRHPDEELKGKELLPIIIFAYPVNQKQILKTIKSKYPKYTEIYCVPDNLRML